MAVREKTARRDNDRKHPDYIKNLKKMFSMPALFSYPNQINAHVR
jgi:hypothetical protein